MPCLVATQGPCPPPASASCLEEVTTGSYPAASCVTDGPAGKVRAVSEISC